MTREFVLEIEKYLDHFVNKRCDPDITWTLGGAELLPPPNAAVGPIILNLHHRKIPHDKGLSDYKEDYFVLDFEDFLEYATSNLAASFQFSSMPVNHCYYYQALPGSFDKPLFENKYGKFSVMAACLSRHENHLWIVVQFKAETEEYLKKAFRMVDLVSGTNNFPNFFVTLHLGSCRREAFSSDNAFEDYCNRFPGTIQELTGSAWGPAVDESAHEHGRYMLYPPFETDSEEYIDTWFLEYAGHFWTAFSQYLAEDPPADDCPKFELESYHYFLDCLKYLPEWEQQFNTEMADQFEVARLMRFLPAYFDFMYDLVITERKEVGHELVRIPRRRKKKTKIVRKPIYKIVKSLRVSYLAEQETRQKLNVPQRKWTAPSYRFTVTGHWRQFSQPSWVGHDQYGNKLQGKTWVKEYDKGAEIEQVEFGTRSPNVVISLKQPLSYARDVIKSHEKALTPIVAHPDKTDVQSGKPSKEWMYEERIKLTAGLRWIILRRDGFKCTICGKGSEDRVKLEVDHIVPIEKWGRTEDSNLRALCKDCNRGKGSTV